DAGRITITTQHTSWRHSDKEIPCLRTNSLRKDSFQIRNQLLTAGMQDGHAISARAGSLVTSDEPLATHGRNR
ncbi:MAG TPA: hypothetical protein VKR59_10140, partial [Terriglobales bacterium]|nr:hypothetical protein [Terriglobales bacterium]